MVSPNMLFVLKEEEVGHASSNVATMSLAPTYNVLNIWHAGLNHALL
jgi:hypothetical protein